MSLIEPKSSQALWELFRTGRARLNKEEQECYKLWFLWKYHDPKHEEIANWILGDIDRNEASDMVMKMEEMRLLSEEVRLRLKRIRNR